MKIKGAPFNRMNSLSKENAQCQKNQLVFSTIIAKIHKFHQKKTNVLKTEGDYVKTSDKNRTVPKKMPLVSTLRLQG